MKTQIEASTDSPDTRYPTGVSIETVHGCNARCVFCHVNLWTRPKGIMTDKVFETIVEQLIDWAPRHVKQTALMLNGEPLLDPNIAKRLALCKAQGLPNVGTTSNGYLMNEERAEGIIDAAPDYIVFSLDTLDGVQYESQRLRLTHTRVLDNVLGFIKKRNAMKSKVRIVLRNIDFSNDRSEFDSYRLFFQEFLSEDLDEIGYTKVHNAAFMPSIDAENIEVDCGTTPCQAVFRRLSIQHDGYVVLCPHDFNGEHAFGNVMESHVLDIFNSPKFIDVRDIHEMGMRNTIPKCAGCDEPELDHDGQLYAKYTPSGKHIFSGVFRGFDHAKERNKVSN